MHELAIAQSIIDVIAARAKECEATHVKHVRLQIGEASGIMTESLIFSFEMLVSLDPVLEGAQLLIDSTPHLAYCRTCDKEFPITNFVPQCTICLQWSNEIVSGTELQILEMEVERANTAGSLLTIGSCKSGVGTRKKRYSTDLER